MTVTDDMVAELAALTAADATWMTAGACRTVDPELWFPTGRGHTGGIRKAKRICLDKCPVRNRCLDYALAYDEQWGIWGGVNLGQTRQRDRDQMREERGINLLTHTIAPWLPIDPRRRRYGDGDDLEAGA